MNLTREEALRYHRKMWSDMQRKLGDCPTDDERWAFKKAWCHKFFPGRMGSPYCFLCDYAEDKYRFVAVCENCPIDWPNKKSCCHCEDGEVDHRFSPISAILALPERSGE